MASTNQTSLLTLSKYSIEIGTPVTIHISPYLSNATYDMWYEFGYVSGTISRAAEEYTVWTPEAVWVGNELKDTMSAKGTIYCDMIVDGETVRTSTCTFALTAPQSFAPTIDSITTADTVTLPFDGYIRTKSQLKIDVTATAQYGSTIASCQSTIDGVIYSGLSFTTRTLNKAGDLTLTVTVSDTRGLSTTATCTITVLDYSPPSLTLLTAERCNDNGSVAQTDGEKVRFSAAGSVSSVDNQNTGTVQLFYRVGKTESWATATLASGSLVMTNYAFSIADQLLTQNFDPMTRYELKLVITDKLTTIEQIVSVNTKLVLLDFYRDGTGLGLGKIAEESGKISFGWPVELSEPLPIDQGGTGGNTADSACDSIGAVKKSGDSMSGNLTIQGTAPSVTLYPTQTSTTNRSVLEADAAGATSIRACQDDNGVNQRALEVNNKAKENSNDNAIVLRTCAAGTWKDYRVFHAGMDTPIPMEMGGTGATDFNGARAALGVDDAENISEGTLHMERLPFKVAYGSTTTNSKTATAALIDYSSAGFTEVPCVCVSYSTSGSNWTGDNGALKIHSKTTTGATIIVGGSFATQRAIDWIAIGV